MDPLLLSPEVNGGNNKDDSEQHHGHCRSRSELILDKGKFIYLHDHRGIGVDGGAHGKDVDRAEDLEHSHHTGDDQVEDGGADHGHSDLGKLLEAAGAVDTGSFVQGDRHILHSGGEQNQLITDGHPHRQQNDGDLRKFLLDGPFQRLRNDTKAHQQIVDRAVLTEQELKHRADSHDGADVRNEEHHAKSRLAEDAAVHAEGKHQRQNDGQGHNSDNIHKSVTQTLDEVLIVPDIDKVFHADPLDLLNTGEEVPIQKGKQNGDHEGDGSQSEEGEQGGGDKRPAPEIF